MTNKVNYYKSIQLQKKFAFFCYLIMFDIHGVGLEPGNAMRKTDAPPPRLPTHPFNLDGSVPLLAASLITCNSMKRLTQIQTRKKNFWRD